jgi:hypothetical protein
MPGKENEALLCAAQVGITVCDLKSNFQYWGTVPRMNPEKELFLKVPYVLSNYAIHRQIFDRGKYTSSELQNMSPYFSTCFAEFFFSPYAKTLLLTVYILTNHCTHFERLGES